MSEPVSNPFKLPLRTESERSSLDGLARPLRCRIGWHKWAACSSTHSIEPDEDGNGTETWSWICDLCGREREETQVTKWPSGELCDGGPQSVKSSET